MSIPKVSVCVPAYNNPEEVERLLKSLFEQTFTDWELIVSDDSKDDRVGCVVRSMCGSIAQERFHYQKNAVPLGHVFNWNEVLKLSHGEYAKIMFSDDFFTDRDSLLAYVELLDSDPKADLGFSGSRQVLLDTKDGGANLSRQNGDFSGRDMKTTAEGFLYFDREAGDEYINSLRADYRHLFTGNQIGAPSAVILRRRKDGTVPLFDEETTYTSDMLLYFDAFTGGNGVFAYTPRPLASIGVHSKQYTEGFGDIDPRVYNDMLIMYKKYDLQDSKECRAYFAREYIVRYHKSIREGTELGISPALIIKERFLLLIRSASCFVQSRINGRSS